MPALRRSSPSPFLNLPLLILLLSIFAFILFFLAIFPSSSRGKLRPTIAVKKSWDCLSVFLVLFAILYGIFARKNDDDLPAAGDDTTANSRNVSKEDETHSASSNWFDQFSRTDTPASDGLRRLKRSSSSYPDLSQDSMWDSNDERYRFFDDFEIRKYQSPSASSEYVYHRRQRSVLQESNVKEIPIYTYALPSSPPLQVKPPPSPAPPPPPPPLPPPATSHRRQKQTCRTVARKEKVENTGENDHKFTEMKNPPSTPPPPPPPPPRPPPPPPVTKGTRSEHSHWKSERKKINATKELKMVLISLYHQSKGKKKQKTKSLYDDLLHSLHEPQSYTVPPPPPAPPPPSVFQSLFRKGSKNKRVYSYSAPPAPPPLPPRPLVSSSKRWSKRKIYAPPSAPPPAPTTPPRVHSRGRNSTATGRPPLPTRVNNMHEENVNSGGQSPLIPMPPPPPPPPPPFRVPGFKFRVQGEYVKIGSAHSSRCSSPESDKLDKRSTKTVNVMDGGDGIGGPVFCPSPDVNAKADTFIARLRGEWRLEKIKSIKEKRSMGLAMDLSPGPSTV